MLIMLQGLVGAIAQFGFLFFFIGAGGAKPNVGSVPEGVQGLLAESVAAVFSLGFQRVNLRRFEDSGEFLRKVLFQPCAPG